MKSTRATKASRSAGPAQTGRRGAGSQEPEVDPRFAPIVAAFRGRDGVTLARMFSSRGVLKRDGKLFAMVVRDELVVKLPRARVDALVEAQKAVHFDPGHGRLMKEWASIAEGALQWLPLAEEAFAYAGGKTSPAPKRADRGAKKASAPSGRARQRAS